MAKSSLSLDLVKYLIPGHSCNGARWLEWSGINDGLAGTRKDVVCVVSDGVILTPNMMRTALTELNSMPEVGIAVPVGPPPGQQRVDLSDTSVEYAKRISVWWAVGYRGISEEARYMSPMCMFIRRGALQAIGGFDLKLWMLAPIDYKIRLKRIGMEAVVLRSVLVHSPPIGNEEEMMSKETPHMTEKWGLGNNDMRGQVEVQLNTVDAERLVVPLW